MPLLEVSPELYRYIFNVNKKIDILLSPPKNYAKQPYALYWGHYLKKLKSRKNVAQNLALLGVFAVESIMAWILYPVALLLKSKGFRFVDIDIDQIGSVIYLDLLIREDKLTSRTPRLRLFVLSPYTTRGNRYLYDLYKPYVVFVRNPFLKFVLSPFFISSVFGDDSSHRFEYVNHTETIAHRVYNDFLAVYGKPLIEMPEEDKKRCARLIAPYLKGDKRFVCIHARDNGFYQANRDSTRNADILSYGDAIGYLIENGITVVRLGDKSMVDIEPLKGRFGDGLFDYAHSAIRSEMMDVYLISHCQFFVGCTSGPASVPPVFGVNSVNVNWYNASNAPYFVKGDLTTIKLFRYKATGELVPFNRIMEPPYSMCPPTSVLEEAGVCLEDNSSQDILETFREFVEGGPSDERKMKKESKGFLRRENYAFEAEGDFSDVTLSKYFNLESMV